MVVVRRFVTDQPDDKDIKVFRGALSMYESGGASGGGGGSGSGGGSSSQPQPGKKRKRKKKKRKTTEAEL